MRKDEAAKFLGVSRRAIERYVNKTKLHPTCTTEQGRQVGVYDPAELEKVKTEMSATPTPRPMADSSRPERALVRRGRFRRTRTVLQLILERTAPTAEPSPTPTRATVDVTEKVLLTVQDCVSLGAPEKYAPIYLRQKSPRTVGRRARLQR